ncbi:MAG: hypothetical protein RQ885_15485 [Desulfurococcales archaeon]|nr:hypothetical protein [Desulfurococcales archaeon]
MSSYQNTTQAGDARYAESDIRMGGYIEGYICKKTGKKINADINAALNIARRLGYKIKTTKKIESYLVTHNGVNSLNPLQRANTPDPSIEKMIYYRIESRIERLGSTVSL